MPGSSTQIIDLLGISQLPLDVQRTIIFICSLKENGAVAGGGGGQVLAARA